MPLVVGIAGGTGSGKSTFARRLIWAMGPEAAVVVSQDNYYRDLAGMSMTARARVNFDHPDSIDADLLASHVSALKAGEVIDMPRYDFVRHTRHAEGQQLVSKPVVIVEGILVFVWPQLRELLDVKIFVDADSDLRLLRRVRRDIADRGRDLESVLTQYAATVRPMHEQYVAPSRAEADLIVPGSGNNEVVVDLLARAIKAGGLERILD